LFLIFAFVSASAVVVFAIEVGFPQSTLRTGPISPRDAGINLVAAAVLGYTGLAIMLRWRRWRIWTGTVSWGLIAIAVLSQFAPPSTSRSGERMVSLVILAVAVFALAAKRWERRPPDLAAVFDD
jgi:hypothetical protein